MKNRLWFLHALITLSLVGIVPCQLLGSDPIGGEKDHISALERFVGHWTIDAKWSDGNELHGRTLYEWGVGNKIITAKTFVKNKDSEYQRYFSIFAWNPKKKCLYDVTFSFDGSMSEYVIEQKDKDTFQIGYTPFDKDDPSKLRQILHFKDKDTFAWTVFIKDGDEWKKIMEGEWKRSK